MDTRLEKFSLKQKQLGLKHNPNFAYTTNISGAELKSFLRNANLSQSQGTTCDGGTESFLTG